MTGPKLNEGVLLLDETQVSTKATARYLRGSASKARQVLDLIRGLDVRRADEVLQFTERAAAQDVRKVLASAVANAVHNDNQDAEELFVVACFADEGPTLKRFKPRARGRASRIRKRTSHITVIVARMSDARLEIVQARQASSSAAGRRVGTTAASRRDRVARSRARAEGLRGGSDAAESTDSVSDETTETGDSADTNETQEFASAEVTESGQSADTSTDPPAGAFAATPAADADKVADQVTDEAETGAASASEKPDASASEQSDEENN